MVLQRKPPQSRTPAAHKTAPLPAPRALPLQAGNAGAAAPSAALLLNGNAPRYLCSAGASHGEAAAQTARMDIRRTQQET